MQQLFLIHRSMCAFFVCPGSKRKRKREGLTGKKLLCPFEEPDNLNEMAIYIPHIHGEGERERDSEDLGLSFSNNQ